MKRFDVIVMFVSLWLLASMVLDVLTPKELTVYAIGMALAPATADIGVALLARGAEDRFCGLLLGAVDGFRDGA